MVPKTEEELRATLSDHKWSFTFTDHNSRREAYRVENALYAGLSEKHPELMEVYFNEISKAHNRFLRTCIGNHLSTVKARMGEVLDATIF